MDKLLLLFIQTCKLNVIIDNKFFSSRTEQARQDLIKNNRKISAKTGNSAFK